MCREIPYVENILEISGIGENILARILAEMGDISRFDDVKEIQKLSGMGLVVLTNITGRRRSATEDVNGLYTGFSKVLSQRYLMHMSSNRYMSITQQERTIH